METIRKPSARPVRTSASAAASIAVHAAVMAALLYHGRHWIAPIRYPGTERGHNIVLSYLPGRAPIQSMAPAAKTPPENAKSQLTLPKPEKSRRTDQATSPNTKSPVSDHPDSTTGADALGSGDINIALAKFFPTPKPDLSAMPRGAKGDVIIDVTIDESGKISDMKLVQGIEHTIDEKVMDTIRQWTFNPANRDGQPVASEQELRFHYEKA
jgi:protein TonB